MIDVNKSHEVGESGISIANNDGEVILYLTTGAGVPNGNAAPVNTWYIDRNTRWIYYKFGVGDNDWIQINANDISFNPAGLPNLLPSDNTVFKALSTLGSSTVEDIAEIEAVNSNAREITTSNGWVSKSGFPWVTSPKTAGNFSIRWYLQVGQTKASRNFGYRIRARRQGDPTYTILAEIPIASVGEDNDITMQSGFKEFELLSNGSIEIDIQHGQTTSGFASIIENVTAEVRRTGGL